MADSAGPTTTVSPTPFGDAVTRTLYDSVTPKDIPRDAEMVAGYCDGNYETVKALRTLFPHATLVTITVTGKPGAHVIDYEPGDVGPDKAAAWAAGEVKAGRHPTIYCMASMWPQVRAAVHVAGIHPGKVNYWIADYDGNAVVPKGAVAKQYLGSPGNSPGHYDVSVVADHWPGVDPAPKPKPTPAPKATPLAEDTRTALRLAARNLRDRYTPVAPVDQSVLTDALTQIERVQGLK